MARFKVLLTYDGSNYSGFQVQDNAKTVQGEIEKALKKIAKGQFIRIHGAGRTDAGVHALGQVIHFDFPFEIVEEGLYQGLNTLLADDILVQRVEKTTPFFHARYHARSKTYEYKVLNQKCKNPFVRHYTHHHPYPMDYHAVKQALSYLVGTHDFTSFTAVNTDKENKVRTIYEAQVHVDEDTNQWTFKFRGNGFLYNMVRIMMGTLLEIADGRRSPEHINFLLEKKDRQLAGPTLSARGLYMVKVAYDDDSSLNR